MQKNNFQIDIKNLKLNDVIVMTFDTEKITLAEAHDTFKYIQSKYPNNQVVGFPYGINVDSMDWQRLYNFVISIKPKEVNSFDEL